MKSFQILILVALSILLFNAQSFAQSNGGSYTSSNCDKELCMTIEKGECNALGQRCFSIVVRTEHIEETITVSFNGVTAFTCTNTNLCEGEICITPDENMSVTGNFGCKIDSQEEGCVVTIDPCK